MRARLALAQSGIRCELREVVLKDKPQQLRDLSSKATVPVLKTGSGEVLDESLDIMRWALAQHDPDNWYQSLTEQQHALGRQLIDNNDGEFKNYLDRYKYADRYPEHSQQFYREQAEKTLVLLERLLTANGCLLNEKWSWADMALLPFIRQFAFVDKNWFDQAPYPALKHWLDDFLQSSLFKSIMLKYPQWQPQQPAIYFP